jgi:cell division protease FtsH
MTAGRSCAEIECIVNEAKISLVHNKESKLKLGDFTAALNRIVFSDIPKENVKDKEQLKLIAYHEVGHALMGYILQPQSVHCISIVPQGIAAGKVKINTDDDVIKKKEYSENMIEIALSGMIAVRVMTGTMTSGNKSDIEKAISIATDMLDEGFYGIEHLSFVVNKDDFSGSRFSSDLTNKRGNKIVEILAKAIANVEKVMRENKGLLEKLAVQLVEKRELSNKEFIEIIENEIKIGSFNSCNVYKSIQKSK